MKKLLPSFIVLFCLLGCTSKSFCRFMSDNVVSRHELKSAINDCDDKLAQPSICKSYYAGSTTKYHCIYLCSGMYAILQKELELMNIFPFTDDESKWRCLTEIEMLVQLNYWESDGTDGDGNISLKIKEK